MTNPELAQAREWAESLSARPATDREYATAEIIQSLPDQWMDAEKVRDLVEKADKGIYSGGYFIQKMKALLTPPLPTLADMTAEEREACQWMQCSVVGLLGTPILTEVRDADLAQVLLRGGTSAYFRHHEITPLPDLPKLKWPAQEPTPDKDLLSGVWVDDGSSPLDALKLLVDKHEELDRLNPEDVPPNEPWLIEVDGKKAIGARYQSPVVSPWSVAALDGLFADDYMDSDVTLIHKLVPEPPALPEGMRLADHEKYGRVVVSPETDIDSDYKVFHSDPGNVAGADWHFAYESELTFLDGKGKESKNG